MPSILTPEQRARKAYAAAYYVKNKEKIKGKVDAYRAANPEKVIAWRARHPDRVKAAAAKYRNRSENKAKMAAWRKANRDKIKAKKAQKYVENRDYIRAKQKARQTEKKDAINAQRKRRYHADPAFRDKTLSRGKVRSHRIRAVRNGCGGRHTEAEWLEILARHGNRCIYCGIKGTKSRPLTRDHYKAIAAGGSNDARNLVPACESCNKRKHTKDPIVFAQSLGRLL